MVPIRRGPGPYSRAVTILLWVCVGLGFAAAFVPRGWLAVPLSLLVGFVPSILGLTWDDGETIGFLSRWTLLWPVMTGVGYALNLRIRHRRSQVERDLQADRIDR